MAPIVLKRITLFGNDVLFEIKIVKNLCCTVQVPSNYALTFISCIIFEMPLKRLPPI